MTRTCYLCTKPSGMPLDDGIVELRPYGPKGADICYECMIGDPKREDEAKRQFKAQLEGIDGPSIIGEDSGPRPVPGVICH